MDEMLRQLPRTPVTTRAARRSGVPARELAGPLWQRLHRGVHVDAAVDADDPDLRIAAVAELLPAGAAIGGWASLRVLGARSLDGRAGSRSVEPVTVCVGRDGVIRPRPGLALDRTPLSDDDVVDVNGVRVTTWLRSCSYLATHLPVERTTALIDAALRDGLGSAPELRRHLAAMRRCHGAPRARVVAGLVDGRSASMPESVLKVVWVLEAGLPPPLVNQALVDDRGQPLGKPDLLDVEAAMVAEYDGSTHRELLEHTYDNAREEGFESHNLVVVRATSIDLWPRRPLLVQRLRDGRARGLARDRSRDRWGLRPA
ncbi:MAG TPA: hypothetical protein VF423_15305 [Actinomycetes bacterium]